MGNTAKRCVGTVKVPHVITYLEYVPMDAQQVTLESSAKVGNNLFKEGDFYVNSAHYNS